MHVYKNGFKHQGKLTLPKKDAGKSKNSEKSPEKGIFIHSEVLKFIGIAFDEVDLLREELHDFKEDFDQRIKNLIAESSPTEEALKKDVVAHGDRLDNIEAGFTQLLDSYHNLVELFHDITDRKKSKKCP